MYSSRYLKDSASKVAGRLGKYCFKVKYTHDTPTMKVITAPFVAVFMKILFGAASIWADPVHVTTTSSLTDAVGIRTTTTRIRRISSSTSEYRAAIKSRNMEETKQTTAKPRITSFPRRCTFCYGGTDYDRNATLADNSLTCEQYEATIPFWLDPNSDVCFEYQFNAFLECGCPNLPRLPSSPTDEQRRASCQFCHPELQIVANRTKIFNNMTCEELSLSTAIDHYYRNESNTTNNSTNVSLSLPSDECGSVVNLTLAKEVCGCKARQCVTCPDGTSLPQPELELPDSLGTCCRMAGEREEYAVYCGCHLPSTYSFDESDDDSGDGTNSNKTSNISTIPPKYHNNTPAPHPCLSICPDGQLFDPTMANKTAIPYNIIPSQTCAEFALERVKQSLQQQSQQARGGINGDIGSDDIMDECSFFWYWGVKNCGCRAPAAATLEKNPPCDICENSNDQPIPDAYQLSFNKTTRYCDTLAGEFYRIFEANTSQCLHAQGSYGVYCGCNNTKASTQVCRVCGNRNDEVMSKNNINDSLAASLLPDPEGLYTLGQGISAPCPELEYYANLPVESGGIDGIDCAFVRELGQRECCSKNNNNISTLTPFTKVPSLMATPAPSAILPVPTAPPSTSASSGTSIIAITVTAWMTILTTWELG